MFAAMISHGYILSVKWLEINDYKKTCIALVVRLFKHLLRRTSHQLSYMIVQRAAVPTAFD